jgi:hypothetical protein
MGGSKERLLNALLGGSRSETLLRFKNERLDNNQMRAATHAIVTRVLRLALVLPMRVIATGIWQKVAGEDLHGGEEHEKHRRAAKRLGPKDHALLSCHIPSA